MTGRSAASPRPWPNATTSILCAGSAIPTRRSNGARTGCSRPPRQARRSTKFALSEINLFKGLNPDECRLVESIVQPLMFEKGDVIIREGAEANLFFVLARGTVSVQIRVPGQGERRKRVASIGPGLSFGEMALLDGGKRSADIVADERVICYGLRVEQLRELTAEHPNILITILSNLTREFSERLRHANEEIGVLE